MSCVRCGGFINFYASPLFDPICINCGCEFPDLVKPRKRKSRGLRFPIYYSGPNKSVKEIGYITVKPHFQKGPVYPLLEVECPICGDIALAANTETIPGANNFSEEATVASKPIFCTQGHSIRLKVDDTGRYTWD